MKDEREQQLELFTARSRRTDPLTSYQAAGQVERSGKAHDQRSICLRIVKDRPGLTAAEIAQHAGLERHVPSRRLPELRDGGLVRNGEARPCAVMGTRALTWWPLERGS